MLDTSDIVNLGLLSFVCIALLFIFKTVLSRKKKTQLENTFFAVFFLIILWICCSIFQIIGSKALHINPYYFEYFIYIAVCFLPVSFLTLSLVFAKTKIKFNKKYLLLLIMPMVTLIIIWTNNFHHLFYVVYSTNYTETVYGSYLYIHTLYTYVIYAISLFIFVKYSIKNSGFFSKQATLIFVGALVPVVTNLLATFSIIPMSTYITPISFAVSVICFSFAMFRFSLFKATPIALQRIVDRISDSYVVLNDNYEISDFNATFVNTFHIKDSANIRGTNFNLFLAEHKLNVDDFLKHIESIEDNNKTASFQLYIKKIEKYFNVEITSIIVNRESLGILVLFKDITQHIKDMQSLKNNQSMLMEQERLASLGQMVGGIAHNLKTPIMSISGASEGLKDLVNEFDASIGNPVVNDQDFHDIAKDMREWLDKINSYTEYMSDILTAVKGQAVVMSEQAQTDFTIGELFKRVSILMKHELKQAVVYLNILTKVDENTIITGDVNSMVQVLNNMISNSIQAYDGNPKQQIDLVAWKNDNNNLVISVRDYGPGLPDKVKKKLFKEMITTKGKNGTGLGLYMSYSNIRAHFGGDIQVETEAGRGTTFNIILP